MQRDGQVYRGSGQQALPPGAADGARWLQPTPPVTLSPRQNGNRLSAHRRAVAQPPTAAWAYPSTSLLSLKETLGMGYLDARAAVVASAERARGQDPIIFHFGPCSTSEGVARAEHSRGREMWLQWIASSVGSGWAFFDPAITGVRSSAGGSEAAPSLPHKLASEASAALQPATEVISTQRRSLDDFLAQVEAKYDGYDADIQSIMYQNVPVWQRE